MSSLDALMEHLVALLDTVLTILVVETVYYARSLTFPFLFFVSYTKVYNLGPSFVIRVTHQILIRTCQN